MNEFKRKLQEKMVKKEIRNIAGIEAFYICELHDFILNKYKKNLFKWILENYSEDEPYFIKKLEKYINYE